MADPLELDGSHLKVEEVLEVARHRRPVSIGAETRARIERARAFVVKAVAEGRPVYGVTTGFGKLSDRIVPKEELPELQKNLVRSHASGVGPLLPSELVRAIMLVRANGLARGQSGVRAELVDQLIEFLNRDLVPAVPSQGSVGASGDLAPLAHVALGLIGEGEVIDDTGTHRPASEAIAKAGFRPLQLAEKEGISLVNGTCLMSSCLAFLVEDGDSLARAATLAAALSFDALRGNVGALDPRLQDARNLPVQGEVAGGMRSLLQGSQLVRSASEYEGQDPYVLRCIPQVFAAVWMGIRWARGVAEGEINAASDNPLVFDGEFLSGGNFHGQPIAFTLDAVTLALSYLATFSERRTARLVDADLSRGLTPFLSATPGLSSGYMIPPYVAASVVSENQVLVHPASAASLPTSANQEDFNSMGAAAGLKGLRLLENVRQVIAIELLVGAQALEQRRPQQGGVGSEATWKAVRRRVPALGADRSPAPDLHRLVASLRDGTLVREVEDEIAGRAPAPPRP